MQAVQEVSVKAEKKEKVSKSFKASDLKEVLAIVSPMVGRTGDEAGMLYWRMSSSEPGLELFATTGSACVRIGLDGACPGDAEAIVNASTLIGFLRSLEDTAVVAIRCGDRLELESGNSRASIPVRPPIDSALVSHRNLLPGQVEPFSRIELGLVMNSLAAISRLIGHGKAMGNELFGNLIIEMSPEQVRFLTLSNVAIGVATIEDGHQVDGRHQLVIPHQAATSLYQMARHLQGSGQSVVEFLYSNGTANQVFVRCGQALFGTTTIKAKVPDLQARLKGVKPKAQFEISRERLASVLRRVRLFASADDNDSGSFAELSYKGGKLQLSCESSLGSIQEVIEVTQVKGQEATLAVRVSLLEDVVSSVLADTMTMGLDTQMGVIEVKARPDEKLPLLFLLAGAIAR